MAKQRQTFDVSKYKLKLPDGTQLKTFELEELDGEMEVAAAERAGTRASGIALQSQFLADAIISFNGETVPERPYLPLAKWPSRTLDFVRKAFHRFSSATEADLSDFERAAFGGGAERGAQS